MADFTDDYEKLIAKICNYIDKNIYLPVKKMLHENNISMNFGYMKEKLKQFVELKILELKKINENI